jgi:protein-tyrosine phosphatase
MTQKISVLFVCMGNICRSPTAQSVFGALVKEAGLADMIEIDSAGTHAYHVGKAPDARAQETARRRGLSLDGLRARAATEEDLACFDYVVVMDQDNFQDLLAICPPEHERKVHMLMDFAPELRVREVPDPYYGAERGFEQVFDLVEAAAAGLLRHIRTRHF